jgi:hypothetical protein
VLLTEGAKVKRVANGTVVVVGEIDGMAGLAVGDGAGTVVVEVLEDRGQPRPVPTRLLGIENGGKTVPLGTVPADEVHLYDVVIVDGAPSILYGAALLPDDDEPSGDVVLQNLATGKTRRLFRGFAPEFFTHRGSAARDTIVTTASSDLTETFAFHGLDGTETTGWHNPTAKLAYNMPPLFTDAVLSPAADALAYLSGPDWDGQTQERTGRWELVVITRDGKERLRLVLADLNRELTRLDFDGRWAAVSSTSPGGASQPPLLIDTHADRPVGHILSTAVGTATIESAARAETSSTKNR